MVKKISAARIVQFHMDKAIREGRLHKLCRSGYGEDYTKENFCPTCPKHDICKREIEATKK